MSKLKLTPRLGQMCMDLHENSHGDSLDQKEIFFGDQDRENYS